MSFPASLRVPTARRFFGLAIARSRGSPRGSRLGLGALPGPKASPGAPWISGQPREAVSVRSGDGLSLGASLLPAPGGSALTAIIAHGYAGRGLEMGDFARLYRELLGCNVLLPDARGHGASGGDFVGFGWPDRLDCLRWIEWVLARFGAGSRIVLHGVSMGAATVLMASGERLPGAVRAIIADCGYTSVDDELSYHLTETYHVKPGSRIAELDRIARRRAGYSTKAASALDQVRKSRTPTLFIHGDADVIVPFGMALQLYDACAAPKELLIVGGAGHGESAAADPEGYRSCVSRFLAKHLDLTREEEEDHFQ